MTPRLLLFTLVLILPVGSVLAQTEPKRRIVYVPSIKSPSAEEDPVLSKLSPQLADIARRNAVLIGEQKDGRFVLEVPAGQARSFGQDITLEATQSPDFPVNQLIVTYPPGDRPTKDEMNASGFELLEVNVDGAFCVVSPMNAGSAGTQNVPGIHGSAMLKLAAIDRIRKVYRNRILSVPESHDVVPRIVSVDAIRPTASGDPEFDRVPGIEKTGADKVQKYSTPREIIVAVIDTGVDYSHQDLQGNMWVNESEQNGQPDVDDDGNGIVDDKYGAAFVNGRAGGNPQDDNGHGTHCAGTVAGVHNGLGVAGMAQTKIMALKFLTRTGNGLTSDAVRCIDYARENGARIISCSWGGAGEIPPVLEDAIGRAQQAGILFVAAAGNDGRNIDSIEYSPANSQHDNVLCVGAVTFDGQRSVFSNFGMKNVDIGAPGGTGAPADDDDILSTWPGGQYAFLAGTSMATPHVAGAAALLLGHPDYRNATFFELKQTLLQNARRNPQLASVWPEGRELDVRFLNGDSGRGDLPGNTEPQPSATYFYYPKPQEFSSDTALVTRRIRLKESAIVHLFASASAAGISRPETFSSGLQIDDEHIRPSYRLATTGGADGDGYVNFGTSLAVRLDAGTHEVKWWIHLTKGGRIVIRGGGSLEAQVFAATESSVP